MADIDKTNDLSDLVVDKEVDGQSSDKKKKIITVVVAVVAVILIALGVMSYMNIGPFASDDSKNNALPNLNKNKLVESVEDTKKVDDKVKEEPIETDEPLAEEPKDEPKDDEPVVEDPIGDQPIDNALAKDEPKDEEPPLTEDPIGEDPVVTDEPKDEQPKDVEEPVVEDPEISKDLDTVVTDVKKSTKKVKKVKKAKKAPKKDIMIDDNVDAAIKDANLEKGYYIQISANQKVKPDQRFISSFEEKGYTVHKLDVEVDGIATTKVLVGPYTDKGEAKDVLREIRNNRDDAFIYYVK